MKKICIVHYNTPYALTCLIKSINLHVNNAYIYVFENSDKELFVNTFDNVEVFDNSHGQIINYEELLKKYPNKQCGERNKWASFKHCLAVDKCFELIDDSFVLMDSDILIKKDFSELFMRFKIKHIAFIVAIFKVVGFFKSFSAITAIIVFSIFHKTIKI